MTVVESGRIGMAVDDERTLDAMFEWLGTMPVPEGFKAEIVGGNVFVSPQRQSHFEIRFGILRQLEPRYTLKRLASDVRIDFPGHLNGFASDVVALAADATKDGHGRWRHQDIEFVAEVISQGTAANDYGPKKDAYAAAGVPAHLIADPYTGRCHLHRDPEHGAYTVELTADFGKDIDLTTTPAGLVLDTSGFPRD
jgi:Uma2 family endonuclease